MNQIVIATRNFGKYKELMEVLEELPFKFVSLSDIKFDGEAEENGKSYEENAILKAEYVGHKLQMPVLADDSGIHVDAIAGELGVATRRWGAGADATDEEWLNHFLHRMAFEENRKAEFISVIALYRPGQQTLTFRGECKGVLMDKPQCEIEPGIPLSSIFLADGKDKVFSAMDKDEKNDISHRGWAIKACAEYLLKEMV